MAWSCFQQLNQLGGQQDLKKIYGPMLQASPEDKYDVSLVVDLDNPPEDPSKLFSYISFIYNLITFFFIFFFIFYFFLFFILIYCRKSSIKNQ